nr:hypothetical protein [Tanacetum cinerariifolium]
MLPIHNVRKNLDAATTSGWKIESTKAFQKIKRRLAKLPTLVVPKEGERLYVKRETCKDGSDIGMNLDSLKGKVYSYAIRMNFYASEDSMDYEALLAELVTSADKGIKDLHVFIRSKLLVDQVEGSRISRTKEANNYRVEIMDAMA